MNSPFLQFNFVGDGQATETLTFTEPVETITAQTVDEVRPALRRVQEAAARGLYAAGYIAYEAAPAFDPALEVCGPAAIPLLWFGLFGAPATHSSPPMPGDFNISDWTPDISRTEYESHVAQVRDALGRGDSYQLNYTVRLRAQFSGDDYAFYQQMRAAQASGYAAYLNLGRYRILSASPELFFRWSGNQIETRPMKGTIGRGRWPEEDERRATWLATSPKNQAENVTIVDLLRNDLSAVAEPGSVCVPELFTVERYRTVFQMTSTVAAKTRPGVTLEDVFAALFPCGSVTGAPKISTMRLIAALENTPRGVYCGAIGLATPGGDTRFNVAIRTVLLDSETGEAEYGAGGGITWDSDSGDEYGEMWAKTRVLTEPWPPFELLETIRLEDGQYTLLDRHLDRIASSARYFDIPLSLPEVQDALSSHALAQGPAACIVRLLVSQQGAIHTERRPLNPLVEGPLPVALAASPVSSEDRFLFHKSTHRQVYDAARTAHPDVFDVLLWNERGEVTEFTIGNLVVEQDGQLWTPPVESGLLAGAFRGELLDRGLVRERVLIIHDVQSASRLWLVNSVRGWVEVGIG